MQKVIALVDCDCFFVSCERVDNPDLNKKPVCVVTSTSNKGIVISRSAEAKALGIKMGAPLFQIKADYPDVFFIKARHKRYDEISNQVMQALKNFSPLIEPVSIDEAYMDLTGLSKFYQLSYSKLIQKIRKEIFDTVKVPVSIGLSTSKTLAKLASDKAKKTNGIFIIHPNQIKQILSDIDLEEISGIGKQSASTYAFKGITTILEFLEKDPTWVKKNLGSNAEKLRYELEGVCVCPVTNKQDAPQSIQISHSFEEFTSDLNVLLDTLPDYIHQSSQKLRQWNGFCKTICVSLKTKGFSEFKVQATLDTPTNSENTLLKKSIELMKEIYKPKILYRSTGISLNNLIYGEIVQHSLFETTEREDDKISHIIDDLEKKYGKNMLKFLIISDKN